MINGRQIWSSKPENLRQEIVCIADNGKAKAILVKNIYSGIYLFGGICIKPQLKFLQAQLSERDRQIESNELNHKEELEMLRKQSESERWTSNNTINKLQKALETSQKATEDLNKALDQEQHLHGATLKELQSTKEEVRMIEQPEEITWFTQDQLAGWISEREKLQGELEQLIN